MEFVLSTISTVSQPRCVEDTDLGKRLCILITFITSGTYQYAVFARKLVKPDRVGLAPFVGTTVLVSMVENSEAVVVNVVASNDIGDEFHDCRLSDTSIPNKKDSV